MTLTEESAAEQTPVRYTGPKTRWQENHGTLLMVFVGVVFLVGGIVILIRQNQFVPVAFPEGDMIETTEEDGSSKSSDPGASVTFFVLGPANNAGSVKIAIYDSKAKFNDLEKAVLGATLPIESGESKWEVPVAELPARFAVAAFHDENGDDRLTRNRLEIPTERYGFSRDARGFTGPPEYEQCVINRPKAGAVYPISIR